MFVGSPKTPSHQHPFHHSGGIWLTVNLSMTPAPSRTLSAVYHQSDLPRKNGGFELILTRRHQNIICHLGR
ncbi:MAG: hypothetical protein JWM11_7311 [Planctomycetaceae bacterium]|nr:hypothetical protein [Planctomycetaceae bacterium]